QLGGDELGIGIAFVPFEDVLTAVSSSACLMTVQKSAGPKISQTACTRSDWSSLPPIIGNAFLPPLVPTNAARWPPADAPPTPKRSGSMLYFLALARSQRIAAW